MAKKKGMNFLNCIGLGSSEEPVEEGSFVTVEIENGVGAELYGEIVCEGGNLQK